MENQKQADHNSTLQRSLGFWAATSIVVGCVIGSGVFVKPGKILASVGGSNAALMAWILGGLITISGGLTIAEVAARIPKTGGVYTYIEELYGKTLGFFCGWVQTVIYGPGLLAGLSIYFALLIMPLLGVGPAYQPFFAYGALFSLVAVNCLGAKYAGMVQELTTLVKLIPIFAIAVVGLIAGANPALSVTVDAAAAGSLGGAILTTLWAYDGWMQVANVAGEMKNPGRDLPRAIVFGLVIVAAVYLAVNLALLRVLSGTGLASLGEDAARNAAIQLFGPAGGTLISAGIVISIYGCLNGNMLGSSRVPYAMAVRKELPLSGWLGKVHPKFHTPTNSILLQALIAVAMMLLLGGEIDLITDLAIFSIYVFFALAFVGIFVLRRRAKGHAARIEVSYHTPLYPIVPLIAIGGSLFMLISKIIDQPRLALYFVALTAVGLPVKLLASRTEPSGR